MTDVLAFLRTLAEDTSRELWRVARKEVTESRLVLPNYRNGKRRVSEQEARSIAQRLVAKGPYFFSIETPTSGVHRFSGDLTVAGRSAQHDLSFYESAETSSLVAHAEFKQGHRSGASGIKVISKDLAKLIASEKHSLWFHSFPKPTRNEFEKLQEFFSKALSEVVAQRSPSVDVRLVLAFCSVVEPEAWIAGPSSWAEVNGLIDAFPVVSKAAHPSWTRLAPDVDVAKTPTTSELEFVDLQEPHEEEDA